MTEHTDREELKEKISSLFPCMDSFCDKNGRTMDGTADEPYPAQCQYCFEVRFPAIDSLIALFDQQLSKATLEAKLEVADKYLGYRSASDTEVDAIVWLDHNRTELKNDLAQLSTQKKGDSDETKR